MVSGLAQENSLNRIMNKVPITTLHYENVPLNGYIDDFFTKGENFQYVKETYTKQCICTTSWVLS